jgi:hypothetical protein
MSTGLIRAVAGMLFVLAGSWAASAQPAPGPSSSPPQVQQLLQLLQEPAVGAWLNEQQKPAVAPSEIHATPFVVRIKLDDHEVARRLPAGSTGLAAIYTNRVQASHVIRKVVLRQTAILNYVNPF